MTSRTNGDHPFPAPRTASAAAGPARARRPSSTSGSSRDSEYHPIGAVRLGPVAEGASEKGVVTNGEGHYILAVRAHKPPHRTARHEAAAADQAGESRRRSIRQYQSAHRRLDAVRGDEDVAARRLAVRELR